MTNNKYKSILSSAMVILVTVATSCTKDFDEESLRPATFPSISEVFIDGFSSDLAYDAWGKVNNFQVDYDVTYEGTAAIRIEVPSSNDPEGNWAGGNFYSSMGRDLSAYDALTFYAKSSTPTSFTAGFGEDSAEDSPYKVTLPSVELTSNWKKVIIPIPNAAKLLSEKGLFYYSAGAVNEAGYTIWIDELRFERLGTLAHGRIDNFDMAGFMGTMTLGTLNYRVNLQNGIDQTMQVSPKYFTFESSNPDVVTVSGSEIIVLNSGNATISPREAGGEIKITSLQTAPTPTIEPSKVISLFSDAYTNVITANWNPRWEYSTAEYQLINANGNHIGNYTDLNFVGIVFDNQADCSSMNFMHLDVMTPQNIDASSQIIIEIHNMPGGGSNGVILHTISMDAYPNLKAYEWLSIDIPINTLTPRGNVAQLALSGSVSNIYIDNIFFHATETSPSEPTTPTVPTTAAPNPQHPASNVVSLFSDVYSNVFVDTWSTDWDVADVVDITIEGNATKLYTNTQFCGIEAVSSPIDASKMTYLHMDIWTPNPTGAALFNIKLVDFGQDGGYGGGDDTEGEITLSASSTPGLKTGEWVSIDIPLSAFENMGLRGTSHLAQIVLSGDLNTFYLDNVYFYNK